MILRSLTARLALGFLVVALVAVGVVTLYVLPSLEERLVEQKLDTLAVTARVYSRPLREAIGSNLDEKAVDTGQKGIAVALNGAVVPRAEWPTTPLKPGDSVEIVRARQGG